MPAASKAVTKTINTFRTRFLMAHLLDGFDHLFIPQGLDGASCAARPAVEISIFMLFAPESDFTGPLSDSSCCSPRGEWRLPPPSRVAMAGPAGPPALSLLGLCRARRCSPRSAEGSPKHWATPGATVHRAASEAARAYATP